MTQTANQFNTQQGMMAVAANQPAMSSEVLAKLSKQVTHKLKKDQVGDFTEGEFWTTETVMRQSIDDWVSKVPITPQNALSISANAPLEYILKKRWPNLPMHYAIQPDFDAQNLVGIPDNYYDIVYSNQILEHIPKPWLAAKEMVRVLKPKGIGIHTSCAYNVRHGPPHFNDYYRFLPDGLAELFEGVHVFVKAGWGNKEAWIYNLTVDDGYGILGGRLLHPKVGQKNDIDYPWHVWIIFMKL